MMAGISHLDVAEPRVGPDTLLTMRPKKDESGSRQGFLKMNNLEEAGPVSLIS